MQLPEDDVASDVPPSERAWSALDGEDGATGVPLDSAVKAAVGDCAIYISGRRESRRLSVDEAALAARKGEGFVWIGLQQPSAAVVERVAAAFGLPELAVEDAVHAHQRPKLDVYGDMLFVVLKPVRYVDHEEVVDVDELAVFVGPTFVVTVRHGASDVLRRVRKELDSVVGLKPASTPAGVLYRTADLVVDGYGDSINEINTDVDDIEVEVFESPEGTDRSERIYKLKREIAEFRRAVSPMIPALERLASESVPDFVQELRPYVRDVQDHLARVAEAIEAHDHLLSDVLQANVARVGTMQNQIALRQNEDMRRISAWAAIALVPTAVAGVYGMNFDNIPELHWRYGYYAVLGTIVVICTGLYRLFRRNGWL
ncbi:MAG: magnesium transporter [Actinomycetota bacterium]|nr:magnesium transporter [Actinomycetota bacterium]